MTKEQEAQQAQTIQADEHWTLEQIIADAKEDDAFWESPEFDLFAVDSVRFYTQKRALLKLVDSQAQKIAEQQSEINGYKTALAIEQTDSEKLRQTIAEQAKTIEKYDRLCDHLGAERHHYIDFGLFEPEPTTDSKEVAR